MRALRQLRYASHYAERYQKREHSVGDVPEKSFRANCAERTLGLRLLSAPMDHRFGACQRRRMQTAGQCVR
jgi:hypothetical protein